MLPAHLIWAIHGGDKRCPLGSRSSPEVKASLANAQKVVPPPGRQSIVVSGRWFTKSPKVPDLLDDLEAYLVWQQNTITWEKFKDLLNDTQLTHITLIAEANDAGLKFSLYEQYEQEFSFLPPPGPDVRRMLAFMALSSQSIQYHGNYLNS